MVMQIELDALRELLLKKKILDEKSLRSIEKQAAIFHQTVFQHIMQYRCVEPVFLQEQASDYFQVEKRMIENISVEKINLLPIEIFQDGFVFPIAIEKNNITLAIANPNDLKLEKSLCFKLSKKIIFVFARYDILYRHHNKIVSQFFYGTMQEKNDYDAKIMVRHLLSDAIHQQSSDIHIEPNQSYLRVRFRVDGLLHEVIRLAIDLAEPIVSALKILSHLDIAIKRMPQDGRMCFQSNLGFYKDCRVSTCPTQFGEKMVIRLLDAHTKIKPIAELGIKKSDQDIVLRAIQKPQGLILVTGPTGSGKTITLYTLLDLLNNQNRNIVTIEDPIEIVMEGLNQTSVNSKSGLTFSNTLRALLRQDPDIMMIGEIRDQETAEMATRAAQTGHLVFSTLHTNNAAEAITRLSQMGIAPFYIANALTLVIAQRLVRKLCDHCKKQNGSVFEPVGCVYCAQGFSGRVGIFEVMPIDAEIKEMIIENCSAGALLRKNQEKGRLNLWDCAKISVNEGKTSLSEIYRVVSNE